MKHFITDHMAQSLWERGISHWSQLGNLKSVALEKSLCNCQLCYHISSVSFQSLLHVLPLLVVSFACSALHPISYFAKTNNTYIPCSMAFQMSKLPPTLAVNSLASPAPLAPILDSHLAPTSSPVLLLLPAHPVYRCIVWNATRRGVRPAGKMLGC